MLVCHDMVPGFCVCKRRLLTHSKVAAQEFHISQHGQHLQLNTGNLIRGVVSHKRDGSVEGATVFATDTYHASHVLAKARWEGHGREDEHHHTGEDEAAGKDHIIFKSRHKGKKPHNTTTADY